MRFVQDLKGGTTYFYGLFNLFTEAWRAPYGPMFDSQAMTSLSLDQ